MCRNHLRDVTVSNKRVPYMINTGDESMMKTHGTVMKTHGTVMKTHGTDLVATILSQSPQHNKGSTISSCSCLHRDDANIFNELNLIIGSAALCG